jgi:peptidyl-prolyl cis-trans isomerase A (cyclophilin A)
VRVMKHFLPLLFLALIPAVLTAKDTVRVCLKTNQGDITLELDSKKAPVTVENFLRYVREKQYDNTIFHRVIDGFMIQGGGFTVEDGRITEKQVAGQGIKNESSNGLKNLRGTIAMARTNDPDSARAQFFINVADNPNLDFPSMGGYAVFGKVIEGLEVVDKIKAVQTQVTPLVMKHPLTGETIESPARDVPVKPVVIISAEIVE